MQLLLEKLPEWLANNCGQFLHRVVADVAQPALDFAQVWLRHLCCLANVALGHSSALAGLTEICSEAFAMFWDVFVVCL
ncbi:hypothetical protein PSH29_19995 [Xanthomonas perforans]|nr:hypothetical protein [Xanthomonas perforans]